jgi:nucleotide-binding universal stress UspA family protein
MKVILVPVADRPECAIALSASLSLGKRMGADVIGCHIRPHRDSAVSFSSALAPWMANAADWHAATKDSDHETRSVQARDMFAATVEAHGLRLAKSAARSGESVGIWRERVGSPDKLMPIIGPLSDMMVVSRPAAGGGKLARIFLMEALVGSTRPVLVLPQNHRGSVATRVAVGWDQSPGASRALAAAMPLIRAAEDVVLVCAGQETSGGPKASEVRRYLLHHGVKARVKKSRGLNPEREIRDACKSERCDLLVMGGVMRTRLTELVLGGVTRDFLKSASIPILMNVS